MGESSGSGVGRRLIPGLTGLAAGAAFLAVASLLAALMGSLRATAVTSSPLVALGGAVIDAAPPWLKEWAISTFGVHDKQILQLATVVVMALVCAGLGVLGAPTAQGGLGRTGVALAVVTVLGLGVLVVVLLRPGAGAFDAVPTVAGLGTGIGILWWRWRGPGSNAAGGPDRTRRGMLRWALTTTVVGALATTVGQLLTGRERSEAERADVRLPETENEVTPPDGASAAVDGVSPYITPNTDFYRIDTALVPPALDTERWRLRVHGLVRREVSIDFEELLAQPMIESLTTLTCVSNAVGGNLVGNAVWTGWPIRELLARAEPLPEADMVLSSSSDGFSASTPLTALTDDRAALLAVGMNGEPLPVEHGYPVRMVVPGLFGYVSATKWVVDLKVTRFADDVAYWSTRGWAERGPIKTSSRIDVPSASAHVSAGEITVAGVAWAQRRGITAVEVRVGSDGPWQAAELAEEPTIDSWRQWWWTWNAPVGKHQLTVRATDGEGQLQVSEPSGSVPDGATGLHTIYVYVE